MRIVKIYNIHLKEYSIQGKGVGFVQNQNTQHNATMIHNTIQNQNTQYSLRVVVVAKCSCLNAKYDKHLSSYIQSTHTTSIFKHLWTKNPISWPFFSNGMMNFHFQGLSACHLLQKYYPQTRG